MNPGPQIISKWSDRDRTRNVTDPIVVPPFMRVSRGAHNKGQRLERFPIALMSRYTLRIESSGLTNTQDKNEEYNYLGNPCPSYTNRDLHGTGQRWRSPPAWRIWRRVNPNVWIFSLRFHGFRPVPQSATGGGMAIEFIRQISLTPEVGPGVYENAGNIKVIRN